MRYFITTLCLVSLGCAGRTEHKPPIWKTFMEGAEWAQYVSLGEGQSVALHDAGFRIEFQEPLDAYRCPSSGPCDTSAFIGRFRLAHLHASMGLSFLLGTDSVCANSPYCSQEIIVAGKEQRDGGPVYYTIALKNVTASQPNRSGNHLKYRVQVAVFN